MMTSGNLLVLPTPDPFVERIASPDGRRKKAAYQHTFNLAELHQFAQENGFIVLEARKFMFPSVGFPAKKTIERWLDCVGLRLLMANQLIVGRPKASVLERGEHNG